MAGFDKRGVDGSGGSWLDAGIHEQAQDALAALEAVRAEPELAGVATGLFGHSQGGWVVIEAATRGTVPFVVCNSGPGVSPAAQERYSFAMTLRARGDDPGPQLDAQDRIFALLRSGAPHSALAGLGVDGHPYASIDEGTWRLWSRIIDHDPGPALGQLRVPVLAMFGTDDDVVPVDESVDVFIRAVAPELLTVAVIAGGDHRLQTGTPPRLVDGYLQRLTAFLRDRAT